MSDGTHLLIPFASCQGPECREAAAGLVLPHLERLLAQLARGATDAGEPSALSMPHERVLARACGLPAVDGRIPWAAWEVRQAGGDPGSEAWAHVTACHWHAAADHVAMSDPRELQLDEATSREFLAVVQPFFADDGIHLEYAAPTLWLARGEAFRDLPTASLDRVIGRAVDPWLPRVAAAGPLRRLQQEVQMLLYTNPTNEDRAARGLQPVSSFWVSGTGPLPATASARPAGLRVDYALREPALGGDWSAWQRAWKQLDDTECTRLLEAAGRGETVTLTLCGDRSAQSWSGAGAGLLRRIGGLFAGKQAHTALEAL
jgi:hypothetical protein